MDGIPVLYEDNHLLVVIKPPGIPTQSDHTGKPDLLSLLKADLKVRHQKPGNVFLGMVHRLDQPVGGVMVFAKTSKGASRLSAQIRARTFEKHYQAVVWGRPDPEEGPLEHTLLKDPRTNTVQVVPPDTPGAKWASMYYRVESSAHGLSLVHIQLFTGRPHQIRAQMAAIGCALRGDVKYGAPIDGAEMALWATQLSFEHPTRPERMTFEAEPPAYMQV